MPVNLSETSPLLGVPFVSCWVSATGSMVADPNHVHFSYPNPLPSYPCYSHQSQHCLFYGGYQSHPSGSSLIISSLLLEIFGLSWNFMFFLFQKKYPSSLPRLYPSILFLSALVAPFLFSIVIKMSFLWPRYPFKSSPYLHCYISWKIRLFLLNVTSFLSGLMGYIHNLCTEFCDRVPSRSYASVSIPWSRSCKLVAHRLDLACQGLQYMFNGDPGEKKLDGMKEKPFWRYKCLEFVIIFFKILFIHERHTERGRHIGRGRSRLLRGARCGTRSQDPGLMLWAKGRHSAIESLRCPEFVIIKERPMFWDFKYSRSPKQDNDKSGLITTVKP